MNTFEKAKQFIYRNARPLDLARWQYHFENGSREAVLNALSYYQNEDGGFGHGLEPDFLNPNSTPMAAWAATEILNEIELTDKNHPVVKGILRYLESGADFDTERAQWLNTVPSNNDYPHAVWWEYSSSPDDFRYNPTAALAGFILKFAERDSQIYSKALEIAAQAAEWFINNVPFDERHITGCFITLYKYLSQTDIRPAYMDMLERKLKEQVKNSICFEKEKWETEYVAKPSDLMITRNSIFYEDNAEIAEYECGFIKKIQLPDGSFPVTWQWYNEYREYEVSANFWRSAVIIKNMLYLKGHGE